MSPARPLFALLLLAIASPLAAQMSREAQIASASLAAPADRRDGAKVYGYTAAGEFGVLREGTNDMVCLADDPSREGFETNCYHISLEPFMARGRELSKQGIEGQARTQKRYDEIQAGTLKMPEAAILYTLSGTAYDAAAGTVADEYRRQTIYMPFATAESTGLSTSASDAQPWIMFPGTAGAHIMITPKRN